MTCCADPTIHPPHGSCHGNQSRLRNADPRNEVFGPPQETETRTTHYYYFYGALMTGYGPSMDPHVCGEPDQPCMKVTEQRKVTPWEVTTRETTGDIPADWKRLL